MIIALLLVGCTKQPETTETSSLSPSLTLSEPRNAAWLPLEPVTVRGTAADVVAVRMDDQDLDRDGADFSGTTDLQRGINTIEVIAEEDDGDTLFQRRSVLAGQFDAPEGAVQDAVAGLIGPAGLDALSNFATGLISPDLLNSDLSLINPVYDFTLTSGNFLNADVTRIDFGAPILDLQPTDGALVMTVTLPDLTVDIAAYGEIIWIAFEESLQMNADAAVVSADILLGAQDGQLTVDVQSPVVTMDGFRYDVSLLPSWIEDNVFVGTIRGVVEDMLVEELTVTAPALIQDALSAFDFSLTSALLDSELTIAADFQRMDVTTGGVGIVLDVSVDVPSASDKTYNGVLAAPSMTLDADLSAMMGLTLSDDLFNRALFEVWRGGLIDQTLSSDDGTLDPELLALLGAEQATMRLSASLPPVVVPADDPDKLQLQIGALQIELLTPGGQYGERLVLDVATTADVGVLIEGQTLSLALGAVDVQLAAREHDWGASDEAVARLFEALLPIDILLGAVSEVAFELPDFAGLTIEQATVSRGDFQTTLAIDLQ
ncbi:MAG: hypothetical protein AAFV53_03140 [Myxococcota bacterium]